MMTSLPCVLWQLCLNYVRKELIEKFQEKCSFGEYTIVQQFTSFGFHASEIGNFGFEKACMSGNVALVALVLGMGNWEYGNLMISLLQDPVVELLASRNASFFSDPLHCCRAFLANRETLIPLLQRFTNWTCHCEERCVLRHHRLTLPLLQLKHEAEPLTIFETKKLFLEMPNIFWDLEICQFLYSLMSKETRDEIWMQFDFDYLIPFRKLEVVEWVWSVKTVPANVEVDSVFYSLSSSCQKIDKMRWIWEHRIELDIPIEEFQRARDAEDENPACPICGTPPKTNCPNLQKWYAERLG